MAELSPEGEDLVRAGRQADRPSDTDRDRVLRALEGRLGLAAIDRCTARSRDANAGGRVSARWALSRWVTVGLAGLAGAALLLALHEARGVRGHASAPEAAARPSASVSSTETQAVASNSAAEREPAADGPALAQDEPVLPPNAHDGRNGRNNHETPPESQSLSPTLNARPSTSTRAQGSLSEEVALLSRAETDLHAGHFESALRALDEHERRFPHGALEQERTAARAQALCAIGRVTEAQASLEQLARTAPSSPNEARARQACRQALGAAP